MNRLDAPDQDAIQRERGSGRWAGPEINPTLCCGATLGSSAARRVREREVLLRGLEAALQLGRAASSAPRRSSRGWGARRRELRGRRDSIWGWHRRGDGAARGRRGRRSAGGRGLPGEKSSSRGHGLRCCEHERASVAALLCRGHGLRCRRLGSSVACHGLQQRWRVRGEALALPPRGQSPGRRQAGEGEGNGSAGTLRRKERKCREEEIRTGPREWSAGTLKRHVGVVLTSPVLAF
jgi:hypothetical protein